MQLSKANWKRLRKETPCRVCLKPHPTVVCLTRRGPYRHKLDQPLPRLPEVIR